MEYDSSREEECNENEVSKEYVCSNSYEPSEKRDEGELMLQESWLVEQSTVVC